MEYGIQLGAEYILRPIFYFLDLLMSIILGILQGFIGNWGMKTIEFYYENSLWINSILLLYALVLSIAWRNYQAVKRYLLLSITSQLESKVKSWSKAEISKNLKITQFPWESARKQIKVPLLAKSGSLLPIFASEAAIEKMFPKDVLIKIIRETNKK